MSRKVRIETNGRPIIGEFKSTAGYDYSYITVAPAEYKRVVQSPEPDRYAVYLVEQYSKKGRLLNIHRQDLCFEGDDYVGGWWMSGVFMVRNDKMHDLTPLEELVHEVSCGES